MEKFKLLSVGVNELVSEMADAVIEAENWYIYDILDGLHGSMPEVAREFREDLDDSQFRFENEKIWREEIGAHIGRKEMMEIKISYWLALNNVLEPRQTPHRQEVEDLLDSYGNIHDVWNAKVEGGAGAAAFPFSKPVIVFYKTEKKHLEPRVEKNISEALGSYTALYSEFEDAMENYTEFRRNELFEDENPGFIKTFFHELVHHHYQKRFSKSKLPEDHSTVTEIFAWNISRHFLDDGKLREPASSYDRPEVIAWGADRIEEIKERREDVPGDRYDWIFRMQKDIFEKAKKHKKESKFPQKCLDIFVIEMLPGNERKKVYAIVQFTGNQFNSAFEDLESFLGEIYEEATEDTEKGRKLRSVLNKLEVLPVLIKDFGEGESELFAPEKFRNRILNDVTGKAINEKLGMQEIVDLVNEHIDEEAEHLLKIIRDLEKLYTELDNLEHTDRYSEEMMALKNVTHELNDIERRLELVLESQ
ncbi:MAG: hypothetical protein ABEK10_02655 [Candidatus Nanosalina sp.]